MHLIGHGVDLIECDRIAHMIDRHGQRFLERVYTEGERHYCQSKSRSIEHYAGRFAAKEAILKALAVGWRGGVAWTDMDIRRTTSGSPEVALTGHTLQIATRMGVTTVQISITHTQHYAMASAVAVGDPLKADES